MNLPTRKLKRSEWAVVEAFVAFIFLELVFEIVGLDQPWVTPLAVLLAALLGWGHYRTSSKSSADSWDRMSVADFQRAKSLTSESLIHFLETYLRTRGANPELTGQSFILPVAPGFDILFELKGTEFGLKVIDQSVKLTNELFIELASARVQHNVTRVVALTTSQVAATEVSMAREHNIEIWSLDNFRSHVA